jgi:hypothetical protein
VSTTGTMIFQVPIGNKGLEPFYEAGKLKELNLKPLVQVN